MLDQSMDREMLETYITDKEENILELPMRPREVEPEPRRDFITTVVGPRRAGKTYLLYLILKRDLDKGVLFLNFEDIALADMDRKGLLTLPDLYEEITGRRAGVLLLDEAQAMKGWELAVRELHEQKRYEIYLTGSSSKLLAGEVATELRGRGLNILLLPLSFNEYLGFRDWPNKKRYSTSEINRVKGLLREYLESGSFPDVVKDPQVRERFFRDYLDLVVYRDIIERHNVKNLYALRVMMRSIISSYSNLFSVNKLHKALTSQNLGVGKRSLYEYFGYLQDALFVFPLQRFSGSPRTSKLSIPKVFLSDSALPYVTGDWGIGRSMENAVYLQLLRLADRDPSREHFYWRDDAGAEVDFVVRGPKGPLEMIQVTHVLEERNYHREVDGLIKGSKDIGCNRLTLITWDGGKDIDVEDARIQTISLWEWLQRG
jgi:predicted AAA+ superfamily ATPase